MSAKFRLALAAGKSINTLVNIVDKSRGSNLSGEKALLLDSKMLSHFKGVDPSKVLFITGTNGKSTTNNLLNHILKDNGFKVISNLEGANLLAGVTTSMIKASSLSGRVDADYYLFETDERFLPIIREQLPAANILITNLQKDQVQRNGDPDYIYRHLEKAFRGGVPRMFINNDEPRSASLAKYSERSVSYGSEKHSQAFTKGESYVTMPCPVCRQKIDFEYYNTDGIGSFKCAHCGYESSKEADYTVRDIDFESGTFTVQGVKFSMPYNTPYMIYNYAACVAVAHEMCGISIEDCAKSFGNFKNVGGRIQVMRYKGKTIKYMRIKQENPETFQSSINEMANDPSRKMVALGLAPLVDFVPHYAVSFYAYDCDFSKLVEGDVEKYFCFTDAVCYDTANRLIYEGVDKDIISIADNEDPEQIFKEIEQAETDNVYLITWLHTYENMEKYLKKEGAEFE